MNDVVFNTGGDWDSTTLYNNGQEVLAVELFAEMTCGRDDFGEPMRGGTEIGGEMTAYIRSQDNPDQQLPIFPGRLVIRVPNHEVVVENTHPQFLFETTQVWLDQVDVSRNVTDFQIQIDAENNIVRSFISIFKPHFFGADEIATTTLL